MFFYFTGASLLLQKFFICGHSGTDFGDFSGFSTYNTFDAFYYDDDVTSNSVTVVFSAITVANDVLSVADITGFTTSFTAASSVSVLSASTELYLYYFLLSFSPFFTYFGMLLHGFLIKGSHVNHFYAVPDSNYFANINYFDAFSVC